MEFPSSAPLINHEDNVASQRYRVGPLVFIYFKCNGMEIFMSEIMAFPQAIMVASNANGNNIV